MGRPRKRRKDQLHPEDYGTNTTPNHSEFMLMLLMMMIIIMIMTTRTLSFEVT
jgi:hypothetical protein